MNVREKERKKQRKNERKKEREKEREKGSKNIKSRRRGESTAKCQIHQVQKNSN